MRFLVLLALTILPLQNARADVVWTCDCTKAGKTFETGGSSKDEAKLACIYKGGTPDNCSPDNSEGN